MSVADDSVSLSREGRRAMRLWGADGVGRGLLSACRSLTTSRSLIPRRRIRAPALSLKNTAFSMRCRALATGGARWRGVLTGRVPVAGETLRKHRKNKPVFVPITR